MPKYPKEPAFKNAAQVKASMGISDKTSKPSDYTPSKPIAGESPSFQLLRDRRAEGERLKLKDKYRPG